MGAFPQFLGTPEERVSKSIDFLNRRIRLTRLGPIQLLRMGTRSPEEVMQDPRAFAAFPCLDLAVAAAEILIQNEVPSSIVVERRKTKDLNVFHISLEVNLQGKPRHVEVGRHLSLKDGAVFDSRPISIRLPRGGKEKIVSTVWKRITYSHTMSKLPAYQILGFPTRKRMMEELGWSIPFAVRTMIKYNRSSLTKKFIKREAAKRKKSRTGIRALVPRRWRKAN